jgi:hypothetical protein
MLRRLSLALIVIVLATMAAAGSAFAHIPFGSPDNPQWGCITTGDPWTGTNPSGVGPFNGALVSTAASHNSCGNK